MVTLSCELGSKEEEMGGQKPLTMRWSDLDFVCLATLPGSPRNKDHLTLPGTSLSIRLSEWGPGWGVPGRS